jgi:hypothetical protein
MNEPITIVGLKKKLRKLGISGYNGMTKEQLLELYIRTVGKKTSPVKKPRSPQKKAKASFDVLFDDETINKFRRQSGMISDKLITKKTNLSSKANLKNFVSKLNEGGLCDELPEYLLSSLKRAHEKPILGEDPYGDIVIDYVYILNDDKKICAILIAHRGECAKRYSDYLQDEVTTGKPLWNWWTVRLICNNKAPDCKGNASKLLGAYCYCLKYKQIQTHGLLEIMNNYDNIAGYCMYSRYGFVETEFPCESFEWLQLGTDLRKLTYRQILDTVATGKKSIPDTGATLYCEELKTVSNLNAPYERHLHQPPRDRYDSAFEPFELDPITITDLDADMLANMDVDVIPDVEDGGGGCSIM